jgi:transcriptional regulator with XRE-family HTH domain
MDKSIWTSEYAVLLELLREAREASRLTQVELAEKIGQSQSFVSKIEIGERRLDLIQLRSICLMLGTDLPTFVAQLEKRLGKKKKRE